MRDLSAAMQTAVGSSFVPAALLAEFDFDSAPVYAWSGIGDIVWDGKTFKGLGTLVNISNYTENQSLQAEGLTFTLNGVDSAMVAVALDEKYQGRTCKLWLAVVENDAALSFILDPYQLFTGLMDLMEISDNGTQATITLMAENIMALLKRSKESRYTAEFQKSRYPGDKGLDFIAQLQDKQITWGR